MIPTDLQRGVPTGSTATDQFFKVRSKAPAMDALLREFIADVDAIGGGVQLGKEWPDLLITYNKAKRLLQT